MTTSSSCPSKSGSSATLPSIILTERLSTRSFITAVKTIFATSKVKTIVLGSCIALDRDTSGLMLAAKSDAAGVCPLWRIFALVPSTDAISRVTASWRP